MIFSVAFTLFLLIDAIGNIPYFIALLKGISPHRQRQIIVRELLLALGIMVIFNFLGDSLLTFLGVTIDTVQIAGGIILFLLALRMVFPPPKEGGDHDLLAITEPFVVPLAIPLIAGPSVLAAVMLYGHYISLWQMMAAILLAWGSSFFILILSPYLGEKMGPRGIIACERLMGLIMVLISIQMFLGGLKLFLASSHNP